MQTGCSCRTCRHFSRRTLQSFWKEFVNERLRSPVKRICVQVELNLVSFHDAGHFEIRNKILFNICTMMLLWVQSVNQREIHRNHLGHLIYWRKVLSPIWTRIALWLDATRRTETQWEQSRNWVGPLPNNLPETQADDAARNKKAIAWKPRGRVRKFLGDLNHTLYNVWWWKSPVGIKRQNVWMRVWKCSICLILVMFCFFIHSRAVVDARSVKRTNFWFYMFLQPKNQYGWHGEIWVWLYNWLYSSEKVDICYRKYIEKM